MDSTRAWKNLFVIAPMRSGSTSMFHYLAEHPEICASPIKEPNYFINALPDSYFDSPKGFSLKEYLSDDPIKPLHISRLTRPDQYDRIRSHCVDGTYFMEASTSYWLRPEAVEKIYQFDPESKIILLVRDPYKRCYSHYSMEKGLGREVRSFEEAIAQEIDSYDAGRLTTFSYLGLSLYDQTIARYRARFKHVLLIRLEDMIEDSSSYSKQIVDFLSLGGQVPSEFLHLNQTRKVFNSKLYNWLINVGIKDKVRSLLGTSLRRNLYRAISKVNPPYQGELKQNDRLMDILQKGSTLYYYKNKDAQSHESF